MKCDVCGNKMIEMIFSSFCKHCEKLKTDTIFPTKTPPTGLVPTGDWNITTAISMCNALEAFVKPRGWHIGLTGGCLYKTGLRKDLDIIVYPHVFNLSNKHKKTDCDKLVFDIGTFLGYAVSPAGIYHYKDDKIVYKISQARMDLFFMCVN